MYPSFRNLRNSGSFWLFFLREGIESIAMESGTERVRVRRKIRIVDPAIQWRIFWSVIVGCGFLFVVFAGLILRLLMTIKFVLAFVPPEELKPVLDQAVEATAFTVMVSLLTMAVAGFYALALSHRIAGPLYRIKSDVDRMLEDGRLQGIRTRRGDLVDPLVFSLNRLISRCQIIEPEVEEEEAGKREEGETGA
ncbi:MAG: hypothetical protein D6679_06195 [Candidatus Hydrogenedentota bacterium]|nr:MAG: hypothetical protein D6679_06195 [Candidatus Hydrogenedentota bacterium]